MELTWPKEGDKLKFKTAEGFHYPCFTNIISFAKENLICGQEYTVRKCEVYSSWCAVWLEEIEGDNCFHLSMFEWGKKLSDEEQKKNNETRKLLGLKAKIL